jgi:HK97 family phage prohead protease
MLFQHDPSEPVGTWLEMHENEKGLHVMGRLDCNVQRGRELLSLLESGGLDGLSIGFKTVIATRDRIGRTRRLHAVDLWEISLVTFPMLEGARVTGLRQEFRNAAEELFASRLAPVPRPNGRAAASPAWPVKGGARQFQPGVN